MSSPSALRATTRILLTLLLVLGACSDGGPGTPADPGDPNDPHDPGDPGDPGDPNASLECEIVGYPCSYADVPLEIIEATLARTDEALDMLDGGATTAEVGTWLEAQGDLAEVQHDEVALRFRLEGGRAMWISGPDALPGPGPDDAHAHLPPTSGTSMAPAGGPVAFDPVRHVAGDAPEKRALVLSPFYFQFGEWDDGPGIRDLLQETRGYEGRVEFYLNPTEADTIPLEHLRSWTDYQVVHVSTHGRRVCEQGVCRGGIDVGLLEAYLPTASASETETIKSLEAVGLEIRVGKETGTRYVRAAADFFREAYQNGLDDTVVFLNACQSQTPTGVDVDIVDALRQGGRAIVLGWSEAVYADDAIAAAQAFFEGLSEHGYPARVAFEKLGDLRTGKPDTKGGGTAPVLSLEGPTDGTDLRIREVVTVLNPYSGAELTSGDAVGAVGVANDGEADAAPFRVLVEGVLEEDAGDMTVHVTVDGVSSEAIPLTDGTRNDDDAWEVEGTVQLPYDITEDRNVTWDARATLHDGGESTHARTAILSAAEPLMGTTWELTGRYTSYYTEDYYTSPTTPHYAEATLYLTVEGGQDPLEPYPRYVLTGGTVFWDYNHVFGDCTRSTPAITFDVTDELPGFGSGFWFDTSTDPATASGRVWLQTPWVTVTSVCDDGTHVREHRDLLNWFNNADLPPVPVTGNGTLVRGTYCTVGSFSNGSHHVQRTDYVMRRLVPGDTSEPPPLHQGQCL